MGEFSPPFSEPLLLLLFFLISQILKQYLISLTLLQKFTPHFKMLDPPLRIRISDPKSKICLDHGASKEPVNPLWSWIHRFLLMNHDPGRSWITDPDPVSKFRKYFVFFSPSLYQRDLDLINVPWISSLQISSFWRILTPNSFNMSVFFSVSETLFSSSFF